MLDGCRVFHDVPIQYGNVDHVVVSHSGVYAVNFKMLGKLPKNGGNVEVTVDNATNVLRFPDRTVQIPIEQLTTEARCLSDFLTKAVGKQIKAEPMLALLGWFVKDRIGRGPVYVFNPRNPKSSSFRTGKSYPMRQCNKWPINWTNCVGMLSRCFKTRRARRTKMRMLLWDAIGVRPAPLN